MSAGLRATRRLLLAAGGGFLLYAGHPPLDWGWAGVVALLPLLLLARDLTGSSRQLWRAFGLGLLAGAVFFGLLLYWLIPFGFAAWVLLAGFQATFVGVWLMSVTGWGPRPGRWVFAVVAWVGLEAIRSAWPLGGFTWGVLGYTQHGGGPLLGMARSVGVLGISATLAALAAGLDALAHRAWRSWRAPSVPDRGPARRPARGAARRPARAGALRAVGVPALSLLAVVATALLLDVAPPPPTGRTVDIAAVQGDQLRGSSAAGVTRLSTERIVRVAERMLLATQPLAVDPPALTVWPENSLDADVRDPANSAVRAALDAALALLDGGPLLVGETTAGPTAATVYNQMTVFTPDGPGEAYRKRKPVPFGEYVPARGLLGDLPPLRAIPRDVVAGREGQVLTVAGARVGAVICFENTFPDLAREQVRAGADVLVVSTNNTSFGDTPMSRQHLAFSQLRAVETGRWVLHAGLSGISGVIDPEGRVSQRTALFEQALVRATLPLVDGRTPADVIGEWFGAGAAALLLAGLVWMAVRRNVPPAGPTRPANEEGAPPERDAVSRTTVAGA